MKDEAQRTRIVASMSTVLGRLALSRDWLTVAQRFEVAELLRDVADVLDRGRTYRPRPTSAEPVLQSWLRRHLIPADRRDRDGRRLFKIIP